MSRFVLIAIAMLLVAPVVAQDKPTTEPAAPQGDVVVTGRAETPKEQIARAVRALAPERYHRQLSRWRDRVCVTVIGLWPERDKLIFDHIGAAAKKIEVNYQDPGKCTPNTIILFTTGADKFATLAMEKFPGLLKDVESFGLPHSREKAPYLVSRPVRWMPVNQTEISGDPVGGGSRIVPPTHENTVGTLIIVDETRLTGVKWSQLADFIAMVTLAQPALDADFSRVDSIMALFDTRDVGRPMPTGLTLQDEAFLAALYHSPGELSAPQQRDEIERSISRTLNGH